MITAFQVSSAIFASIPKIVATSLRCQAGDVFLLAAEGAAWTSIKGNLPSFLSLNTIYVDWRGALPRLFVGTNRGVYQSVDLGVTWSKFSPRSPEYVRQRSAGADL